MSKRVSNKKGGGGARCFSTINRHREKEYQVRQRADEFERMFRETESGVSGYNRAGPSRKSFWGRFRDAASQFFRRFSRTR